MAATRPFIGGLRILHLAITLGALFFMGFAYYSVTAGFQQQPNSDKIFYIVAVVIVVTMPVIGTFFFKQRVAAAQTLPHLNAKIQAYRAAFITRIAFIDGAIIFPIVVALVTADVRVILLAVINFVYLFFTRPTEDSVALDLALSPQEKEALQSAEY